ncbi:hypothetical protein Hanom_Chr06g00518751 [Helianthus anomalus]
MCGLFIWHYVTGRGACLEAMIPIVKVPPRLRVLPEYLLQGRLPRNKYSSPRPITTRVISA